MIKKLRERLAEWQPTHGGPLVDLGAVLLRRSTRADTPEDVARAGRRELAGRTLMMIAVYQFARELFAAAESFGQARAEAAGTAALRGVYSERAQLVALLASHYPSYAGSDPEEPEFPVVYLETPAGQLAWHIAPEDWRYFAGWLDTNESAKWDGHSTEQKYERIRSLIGVPVAGDEPPVDFPRTRVALSRQQRDAAIPRQRGAGFFTLANEGQADEGAAAGVDEGQADAPGD